ncbi:MAG TPA: hypothetical protein VL593_07395 [Ramlibacter sp.]|nr:hypothetical protein [Ramlibacter sp.]
MARIAWPLPFPLGVADADAGLALCKALDDLIVLRLADGSELWRERMDAQPLLVGHDLAVVLNADEVLAYSLGDADLGAISWRVTLPSTPTETQAVWIDDDIAVHWLSRERYRGGANPGSRAAAGVQEGQCCIRPSTGSAHPLRDWPAREAAPQWESSEHPSVLSACAIGGVRYRLSTAPGKGMDDLRLEALRTADDSVIWAKQLGTLPSRPPPRLRP